ncbi:MAG: hypothetical protein E7106_01430 [Prevotella sp.]|nr:hypothetical protein [Prevotella sp.]
MTLLALCCWQGCTTSDSTADPQPPQVTDGRVAVDLALSVSTTTGNSSATTRMAASTVQAEGNPYRGIQDLKAYALNSENTQLGYYNNLTPVSGTRHFYTNQIDLSIGTNHFLCYAKAVPGSGSSNSTNGAITPHFVSTDYSQNTFEPVQIISSNPSYATANTMAEYLTTIVTASSENDWINDALYRSIVPSTVGGHIAGSSANLYALIIDLKAKLVANPTTIHNTVLGVIGNDEKINTKLSLSDPYPASIGLPDGSAALEWDGSKFVAVTSFNSGTPLSDHTRFIYPPELYYYIDSPIKTATSSLESEYTDATWSNVLAKYTQDDATVSSTTRSVAVKNALDYAVGCLEVYLMANSAVLLDNADADVALNFNLTGIILGGQYKQNYQFTAIPPTSNTDEKIIYDKEVPSGINLTTSWTTTPVYTLAFQSTDEKPVDIVLEFMNNGAAFTGEGGIVHHNTKFYLVGQIWPEPEKVSQGDFYKRVFTKDYRTKVKLNIQSLKHAYNVIPDLKTAAYSIKVDNVAVTPWSDGGSQNHELYNW